ncbi:hypothetical protein LTR85_002402 [Meristemomyces frigidus]|nr:hypothetical protein LTR85_002402 [Meristemomyces frigidus]
MPSRLLYPIPPPAPTAATGSANVAGAAVSVAGQLLRRAIISPQRTPDDREKFAQSLENNVSHQQESIAELESDIAKLEAEIKTHNSWDLAVFALDNQYNAKVTKHNDMVKALGQGHVIALIARKAANPPVPLTEAEKERRMEPPEEKNVEDTFHDIPL